MGFSVTKMGMGSRLWAVAIALLGYGSLPMASAAPKTFHLDTVYVQAQAWQTNNIIQQSVVVRAPEFNGASGNIMDLWPKAVSYSPQTEYVVPYIQDDLSLGIQYNYQFNFEVKARGAQGEAAAVPDGWYQVQLAVIRKSPNNVLGARADTMNPYARYVTSTSNVVKITGGQRGMRVSLRFPNVTMTSLKHHLFVELIPLESTCKLQLPNGQTVNDNCIKVNSEGNADLTRSTLKPRRNIRPFLIETPFVPYVTTGYKMSDTDDVRPSDLPYQDATLSDYISKAQLFQGAERLRRARLWTAEGYARRNKLNLMSPNDELLAYIGQRYMPRGTTVQSLLEKLLRQKAAGAIVATEDLRPLFSVLCEALIQKNAKFQRELLNNVGLFGTTTNVPSMVSICTYDSHYVFRMARITHVGRPLTNEVKKIAQKAETYTTMANFMMSRSNSQETSASISFKPASILFKFLESAGINMGFVDFGTTASESNSRARAEMGLASMSSTMDFDSLVMNIPTTGSRQCLEVRPVQNPNAPFWDMTQGALNGFYICDPVQTAKLEIQELYAHVFDRCRDTTILDCYDPLTQMVNFGLRGEREVAAFFYTVRRGLTPDHDNQTTLFGDIEGAEQFFGYTPMTDRMMVISPVAFPKETIPNVLGRLLYQHHEQFN